MPPLRSALFLVAFLFMRLAGQAANPVVYSIDNSLEQASTDPVYKVEADANNSNPAATLRISTGKIFQTMAGVGAAFSEIGGLALATLPEQAKDTLITSLFDPVKGAGFSMCRLPVGSSDFATNAYSYDEVPGDLTMEHFSLARDEKSIIPAAQAALKKNPNLHFFASPWSPPGWMKTTGTMDKGGKTNNLLDQENIYKAYTLYFEKYIQGYGAKGITVNRLCPQNEMDASTGYPSCVMPPRQMVKLVVDNLAPAFQNDGIKTEIWPGTFREKPTRPWAAECLKTPAFRKAIVGLGIQYYNALSIEAIAKADPTLRFMYTEASCNGGKNKPSEAQNHFREMIGAFLTGCDSYAYWNMILDENQKSGWGWKQNSLVTIDTQKGTVRYNADFQPMYLVSRFLKPGDVRIDAEWADGRSGAISSQTAAFLNPDGTVTAFVQNLGTNALPIKISLDGKESVTQVPGHSDSAILIPKK